MLLSEFSVHYAFNLRAASVFLDSSVLTVTQQAGLCIAVHHQQIEPIFVPLLALEFYKQEAEQW